MQRGRTKPIMRKEKSIETNPELPQMLELADRNIKTVIITLLCAFKNQVETE